MDCSMYSKNISRMTTFSILLFFSDRIVFLIRATSRWWLWTPCVGVGVVWGGEWIKGGGVGLVVITLDVPLV